MSPPRASVGTPEVPRPQIRLFWPLLVWALGAKRKISPFQAYPCPGKGLGREGGQRNTSRAPALLWGSQGSSPSPRGHTPALNISIDGSNWHFQSENLGEKKNGAFSSGFAPTPPKQTSALPPSRWGGPGELWGLPVSPGVPPWTVTPFHTLTARGQLCSRMDTAPQEPPRIKPGQGLAPLPAGVTPPGAGEGTTGTPRVPSLPQGARS